MSNGDITPPIPFKSDGCTLSLAFNFKHCCLDHDRQYWQGGTKKQRAEADLAFRDCIRAAGHPVWAEIYYSAARVAASPYSPVPWRWGFGWPWPKGYVKG